MSQPEPNSRIPATVVKAQLQALPKGKPIPVHFNPASLVYTVENSSPQQGGDPQRRQFAAQFTGKLTMDLQFDTTDTGTDVRKVTSQVAAFMQPSAKSSNQGKSGSGANKPAPPVLSFSWGAYHFQGFMESFKETIDFFSADGIPLRALVSIGLARQDKVFDAGPGTTTGVSGSLVPTAGGASGGGPGPGPGPGTTSGPQSRGASVTSVASQGGDPNAARALASANNVENPRFTGGASLQVGGGIQLNPAVSFVASASVGASASAAFGASAGLGLSLTAGAGASAGVGFGVSTGASAGGGASATVGVSLGAGVSLSATSGGQVTLGAGGGAIFGSRASAGVAATQGAFAGLEVGRATVSTTVQLDPLRMLPATVGSDVSASSGASFGLGGVALSPTGFSTDVGAGFSFNDRLTFDSN